jgi:hypothetical protein
MPRCRMLLWICNFLRLVLDHPIRMPHAQDQHDVDLERVTQVVIERHQGNRNDQDRLAVVVGSEGRVQRVRETEGGGRE